MKVEPVVDEERGDAVQEVDKPRQQAMTGTKAAKAKEYLKNYPTEGDRKEKKKYVWDMLAEYGIKPRHAACCCCCSMFTICAGMAMLAAGIIFMTRNLVISGNNSVLRASNGEAVATAEASIKVNLGKLRSVANDPDNSENIGVLRDLTELTFKMALAAGGTKHITMRIAEAHVNVGPGDSPSKELILNSASGNFVKVPGDASLSVQYCNPTCQDILLKRRRMQDGNYVYVQDDDGTFVVYERQQVPTEEYMEEDEVSQASTGTKIAAGVILGILLVCMIGFSIMCPEVAQVLCICLECLSALG